MDAQCSEEIPTKERNKLYSAMGRMFEAATNGKNPQNIHAAVLARYAEEKNSPACYFGFLKQWCNDTTCANITFNEHHVSQSAGLPKLRRRLSTWTYDCPELLLSLSLCVYILTIYIYIYVIYKYIYMFRGPCH